MIIFSDLLILIYFFAQAIGNTTSGCFSPVLGKGLVHAYVPAIVDVPGNQGGGEKNRIEFTSKSSNRKVSSVMRVQLKQLFLVGFTNSQFCMDFMLNYGLGKDY